MEQSDTTRNTKPISDELREKRRAAGRKGGLKKNARKGFGTHRKAAGEYGKKYFANLKYIK